MRHRIAIGPVVALTAINVPARLLLVDRIPADLHHLDRVATVGCDCSNPFAVTSAPALFARIESVTGVLSAAGALLVISLVILRLTNGDFGITPGPTESSSKSGSGCITASR